MKYINFKSVCFTIWMVILILNLKTIFDGKIDNHNVWLQLWYLISTFIAIGMIEIVMLTTIPKYCKRLLHDYIVKVVQEEMEKAKPKRRKKNEWKLDTKN